MSLGDTSTFVICVTGPECTGKTTMAHDLAEALDGALVSEYAREYASALEDPTAPWPREKYIAVAAEQLARIEHAVAAGSGFIVTDTDPFTIWAWHRLYTPEVIPELRAIAMRCPVDLHVLADIDLPFREDGVRKLIADRDELLELFEDQLADTGRPWTLASGPRELRVAHVLDVLAQQGVL